MHETMLGRYLTFESSGGPSLTLEVSGRRVLRMTGATGLTGAESCLAAQALEDEQKDDLIKLLQTVAAPGQELRVLALPNPREGAGVSVGIPVALLADLLLIDLNPAANLAEPVAVGDEAAVPAPLQPASVGPEHSELEPEAAARARITVPSRRTVRAIAPVHDEVLPKPKSDQIPLPGSASEPAGLIPDANQPLSAVTDAAPKVAEGGLLSYFAQATGSVLISWLVVGGQDDGRTEGPEEMVSHLQGFLGDEAPDLGAQLDLISSPPGKPVCIVLGATLVEGHSVICARYEAGVLIGVIEGDATQSILRAWSASLGG